MKDLSLLKSEIGQYLSLLESVKESIFGSLWTSRLRVLELMLAVFASNVMDLLGFLLILSRMHLIIDLDRWERGLPHLGRSDKSPLFETFQCFPDRSISLLKVSLR